LYEKPVWETVLKNNDLQEKLKSRALFGHAEHPNSSQSDLQLTSHVIVDMSIDEKENVVYQTFDVVDTPTGRIVDTLLRAKCMVGCSTRAEGDIEEAEDKDGNKYQRVIPEKYKYITTDFTADPSTFGAIPIEVKRGAVSAIRAESLNQKSTDNEKKFATILLESMKCNDKSKCQKCGCCEDKKVIKELVADGTIKEGTKVKYGEQDATVTKINEGTVNLTIGVGKPTFIDVHGDATILINPEGVVTITPFVEPEPTHTPPEVTEKPGDGDAEGEMAAEDLPPSAQKEPDEEVEEKIDETKAIDDIYKKAGFTPPDGKGIHTVAFHKLAVDVAKGYKDKGESEGEALNKGYATAMDQLGKEKAVKSGHRKSESKVSESNLHSIAAEMGLSYHDLSAGYAVKNGKTYHKFHNKENTKSMWIADKDDYVEKLDDTFELVGANESKVNEVVQGVASLYVYKTMSDEFGIYAVTDGGTTRLVFAFADEDEAKTKGQEIAEILGIKFSPSKPMGLSAKYESVESIAKDLTDLKIKEAISRSELEVAKGLLEKVSNKDLEIKMLVERLKVASSDTEVEALTKKLEEKVKDLLDTKKLLVEKVSEIEKLTNDCKLNDDKLTIVNQSIVKLTEDNKKLSESLVESENKVKAVIKEYIDNQLVNFGKVHDNVRALLEDCKTLTEVNRVLDEYRDIRRRNALHSIVSEKKEEVKEPVVKPIDEVGRRVNLVCEHLIGK
jgi:hypothetical protein